MTSQFDFEPREVRVDRFEPGSVCRATFVVINKSKHSVRPPRFHLNHPSWSFMEDAGARGLLNDIVGEPSFHARSVRTTSKLAPGMRLEKTLLFTHPEDVEEVHGELQCSTSKGETFIIPLVAFGTQPELVVPPVVEFKPCYSKQVHPFSILNSGCAVDVEASVEINEISFPYDKAKDESAHERILTIEPRIVKIPRDGAVDFSVYYNPDHPRGSLRGIIVLRHCRTQAVLGRSIVVATSGESDVEISTDVVLLGDCFVHKDKSTVVWIRNNGDEPVSFRWNKPRNGSSKDFRIEPAYGEIAPMGRTQVTFTFSPLSSGTKEETVECCVSGSNPLPVVIQGFGVGPRCVLSAESVHCPHAVLNSVLTFAIELHNVGEIDTSFVVRRDPLSEGETTRPIMEASVVPRSGQLVSGSVVQLQFEATAAQVGEFRERFFVEIEGRSKSLRFDIHGQVYPPDVRFVTQELNFGECAPLDPVVRTACVRNDSSTPALIEFSIEPRESNFENEFTLPDLVNNTLIVPPNSKKDVVVQLRSNSCKTFETQSLQFSFVGVSPKEHLRKAEKEEFRIPIQAKCLAANCTLAENSVIIDSPFVGAECTKQVELSNLSAVPATVSMELLNQLECDGIVEVNFEKDIVRVEPQSKRSISISMTPLQLGNAVIQCILRVVGNEQNPIYITFLVKRCKGPRLQFDNTTGDCGSVNLFSLKRHEITLENISSVPADVALFLSSPNSPFYIDTENATIPANSTLKIPIDVLPTQKLQHKNDELRAHVTHGEPAEIVLSLRCKIQGTEIVVTDPSVSPETETGSDEREILKSESSPQDVNHPSSLFFGNLWVEKPQSKQFRIANHSAHVHNLRLEFGEKSVFSSNTRDFTLQPESFQLITFACRSSVATQATETIKINDQKSGKNLCNFELRANVFDPVLGIVNCDSKLDLTVTRSNGLGFQIETECPATLAEEHISKFDFVRQAQGLLVRNLAGHPMTLRLQCEHSMFTLSEHELYLPSNEERQVDISFCIDPREHRTCAEFTTSLDVRIVFNDMNERLLHRIPCHAQFCVPQVVPLCKYLRFENQAVDTIDTRQIRLHNPSHIPACVTLHRFAKSGVDVEPISSVIPPHSDKDFNVSYQASSKPEKCETVIQIQVEGGASQHIVACMHSVEAL